MNDDEFFLHTLSDIEEMLNRGDEYSMLRASGLLRQLLLDGSSSLLHRVNKNRRMEVTFPVCGRERAELRIAQGVQFYSALGAIHSSGSQGSTLEKVRLDAFLVTKLLKLGNHVIAVRDLIRHSANVSGGVHRSDPKKGDDKAEQLTKWTRLENGANITISTLQLQPLLMVVLDALDPLRLVILRDNAK